MLLRATGFLLLALLCLASLAAPAPAQQYLVVQACGTVPLALTPGTAGTITMDVNGRLCDSSGVAGGIGSAVLGGGQAPAASIPVVEPDAGAQISGTCSAACNGTSLPNWTIDTTGYRSIVIQSTSGAAGGNLQPQGSNDIGACSAATNWTGLTGINQGTFVQGGSGTGSFFTNVSGAGVYIVPVSTRCFRLQFTAYASGTQTSQGYLRTDIAPISFVGSLGVTPAPQTASVWATSHASLSSLGTQLVVKASAGNLYNYNCSAINGNTAGTCIAVNLASTPATGALTGTTVLSSCTYTASPASGCAVFRTTLPINFSTGIVILCSSGITPFTFTTGTNTCFIEADFQ